MQQHRVETQILREEQILEAIDQLRRRKARPDADRICNYLLRKFSVDARDTIADLHRLIEAEKVIQVDYKGNTSYRNASKWSRLQLYKNRPEGFVKEKLNSSMIAGAVAELVVEEPDYLYQGVPAYRLVEQLLDGVSNPTSRRMVEDFLGKEVASGNIARLGNGNYSLVATTDMTSGSVTSSGGGVDGAAAPPAVEISTTSISDVGSPVTSTMTTTTATTTIVNNNNDTAITSVSSMSNNNSNAITTTAQQQQTHINNIVNNNNNNNNNNLQQEEQRDTRETSISTRRCYNPDNGNADKSSYDRETTDNTKSTDTTRNNRIVDNTPRVYDFDESDEDEDEDDDVMVTDSRSNTPRSSQASPVRQERINDNNGAYKANGKDECYEITVVDKEPDSPEESVTKEDDESRCSNIETRKNDDLCRNGTNNDFSNLKRPSKSERKQRLLVRTDDPMDIEIKFEDFGNDNKDDRDKARRDTDVGHQSDERDDDDAGRSSTNPSPTPSNTTVGSFRSARRKRAKKVFDPSDNNVVKRKRGRPVSAHKNIQGSQESQDSNKSVVKEGPNRQCSLCAKEKSESLVACRDCTVRAHPTCIYSPEELLQKVGCSWQCERCKSCTVCCETSDVGPLITCYTCDEAYHHSCHTPRVSKSTSKWQCNDCTQKHFKTSAAPTAPNSTSSRPDTPSNTPALPPVLSPQVSPTRASSEQMDDEPGNREGIDPNIPDASDWTSEQVYQYFARLFPKEAEVFRVQDIDGHSLLLMKRTDVLSGLDLLLGPALKIYRHVLKLQMRRDDPRLYWL